MEFLKKQPTVKAPAETFTGDAWFDVIVRGEGASRIRVSVVRFAPGARNTANANATRKATLPGTATPLAKPCT